MKFSGKMCLKIILKVTKNQGFSLSLEDTLFEKPQGGGVKLIPPAVLGLTIWIVAQILCTKKRSFTLRISSVNVTKLPADLVTLLKKSLMENSFSVPRICLFFKLNIISSLGAGLRR